MRTAATADVAASSTKIQSSPTDPAMMAPTAGPTTKAAQEAPSISALTRARRSGSSVRKGPNEDMAV
jgi:hypothetical protein